MAPYRPVFPGMANVTHTAEWLPASTGTFKTMEEMCPICGGDDIGCLYGDWLLGDDDLSTERSAAG